MILLLHLEIHVLPLSYSKIVINEYTEHDGVKLVMWKLGTGVW